MKIYHQLLSNYQKLHFLSLDNVNFIKEYKIKPLLEEYFYVEEITADSIIIKDLEIE